MKILGELRILLSTDPHRPMTCAANLPAKETVGSLGRRHPMNPAPVLSTVNAPHREKIDARQLADCLLDPVAAQAMPGHMSVFFGEVDPVLQLEFASQFGISKAALVAAAQAFGAYSGQSYPLGG